jgi:N-acylneuraminate cytidylyltransferase
MRVGVIPARGGSKRIPRKNIREFGGKPIIAWSIEALMLSSTVDMILVSTDDDEIANIALAYGAEVPFIRPKEISDDYSTTGDVMKHAVQWLIDEHGRESIEEVCCMYATAPFTSERDLKVGLKTLVDGNLDYVFTAVVYGFPLARSLEFDDQGYVRPKFPEKINMRPQDLEVLFHDAAQFYWGRADSWLHHLPIFSSKSVPLILPQYRVQDIDNFEDWKRAELMFKLILLDNG